MRQLNQTRNDRLDILMCNAGVMPASPAAGGRGSTKDCYEIQFGIDHLGHALLINQFLHLLLATAELPNPDVRIINVTLIAYQQAPPQGIEFSTLRDEATRVDLECGEDDVGGTGVL